MIENRVRVLVKGKLVVDYTDEAPLKRGRVMLRMRLGTRTMRYRKMAINELPSLWKW